MDKVEASPVEIDSEIARLYTERNRHERVAALQRRYRDTHRPFSRDALDVALAEIKRLNGEISALNDEWLARGAWPRYHHVTNANGHIHSSLHCSSCFDGTQYVWRTDLSGLTDVEVVEREAYNACSVCMPIAPAEQKAARERYNREQREARAAEKQAKKDEKLRKAAERAVKFIAKVDKVVAETFGTESDPKGWTTIFQEYSLHGHDGRKSLYDATFDMPAQVGNYLYDEMKQRESGRVLHDSERHQKDPAVIIAEAREKGLI